MKTIKKTKKPTASKNVKIIKKKTAGAKTKSPILIKAPKKRLIATKHKIVIASILLCLVTIGTIFLSTVGRQIASQQKGSSVLGTKKSLAVSSLSASANSAASIKVSFRVNNDNTFDYCDPKYDDVSNDYYFDSYHDYGIDISLYDLQTEERIEWDFSYQCNYGKDLFPLLDKNILQTTFNTKVKLTNNIILSSGNIRSYARTVRVSVKRSDSNSVGNLAWSTNFTLPGRKNIISEAKWVSKNGNLARIRFTTLAKANWFNLKCKDDSGAIEYDEKVDYFSKKINGKTYYYSNNSYNYKSKTCSLTGVTWDDGAKINVGSNPKTIVW